MSAAPIYGQPLKPFPNDKDHGNPHDVVPEPANYGMIFLSVLVLLLVGVKELQQRRNKQSK